MLQMLELRQEVDGPYPHPPTPISIKRLGDSFPIDCNSRRRIAGQLREESGPCPDDIFLSQETSLTIHVQKGSLEAKGGYVKGCSPPICPYVFVVGSILAKRCMCTHGRILRYTKYGLCTRQIKMISQRKPRRKLHKSNSDCHEGAAQRLSHHSCLSTLHTVLFFSC